MADEIGIAFQKVGGSAGALQLDFQKVASWIAEISSKTRESATTVGDSIRSILARVQSLKETGFTEEGQSVNQVAKALNEVGIKLMDAQGQFRNFGTVMDELGAKWKTLDSRQKAYIATTVAGTYQQSRFENLMEGYDDSVKLYQQTLDQATGQTQKKFDTYMESTEAHLNRLKDSWSSVFQETFHSDTINTAIDLLTGMANGVGNLVHTFGTLPIAVGLATTAIIAFNDSMRAKALADGQAFFSNLKQLPSTFKEIGVTARAAAVSEGIFAGAEEALAIATRGLGVALKTTFSFLAGTVLPVAGFVAFGYAVEKVTGFFVKQHQELQKQKEEVQQLTDAYKGHSDEVDSLVGKYDSLSKQVQSGSLSSSDKEYLNVQQQIADILPNTVNYIDSESQAHLKNVEAVKSEIKYLKQLQSIDYRKQIANFNEDFKTTLKDIDDINTQLGNLSKKAKTGFNASYDPFSKSATWQDTLKSLLPNPFEPTPITKNDVEKNKIQASYDLTVQEKEEALQKEKLVELTQRLEQAYASLNKSTNNLTDSDNAFIKTLIEKKKGQLDDADSAKKVASQMSDVAIAIGNIRGVIGQDTDISQIFKGFTPKQIEETSVLFDLYKQGKISIDDVKKSMTGYGISADDASKATNVLTDAQKQNASVASAQKDAQDTLTKILQDQMSVEDALGQSIVGRTKADIDNNSKLIEIYSALSKATNLTDEQTQLLILTREKLAEQYPDLVNGQKVNINGMYDEINAENVLYQAVISSAKGQLDAEHQKTLGMALELENQKKIIQQQINLYKASFNAMMASHDGRLALNGGLMNQFRMMEDAQKRLDSVVVPGIQKAAISLGKYLNISPTFKTPDWNYDTSGTKGSKSSKGSSTADTQAVNKYQTDAFSKSLADLELQLKQSQARLDDYDKTSADYRNELNHQIDLIKQEESLTTKQISTLEKRNDALNRQLKAMGNYNKLSNKQKQTYNDIAKAIDDNINKIDDLKGAMVDYGQKVQDVQGQVLDSFSAIEDMIVNNINAAMQQSDDSYDSQIKKLQEKLDLLDQEYDKEDRNAKLRDIQNQIDTAKADKRFEYINDQGQVELTYDKGKVSDLEKQQDDLIQQYNREDAKKAIQDQIDRLQKAKDDQHAIYEQQVQDTKDFWDKLVSGIKDGTISFDDLMNGKDGFYSKSLDALSEYGINVSSLIDSIKQAFESLGNMSISAPDLSNQKEYLQNLKKNGSSGQQKWANDQLYYLDLYQNGNSGQQAWAKKMLKFHDGGVVSSSPNQMTEIANKVLNTKLQPNEQVIKVLKGELLSPAANIAQNFIPNLRMIASNLVKQPIPVSADSHYHFNNLTIKSNNMTEFIRDIHFLASSKRT